jgi:hypothetical protein
MFDSMDSELDAVIERAEGLFRMSGRELESLTLHKRHASEFVVTDIFDVVGRLAMVAVLRSAVPTRHDLAIVEHLEEVRSIRWMRSVNRILKPDLRAWVDRHIAGSHRVVV